MFSNCLLHCNYPISTLNTLDKTERDCRRFLQRERDGIGMREREGKGLGKGVTERESELDRQEDKKKRLL